MNLARTATNQNLRSIQAEIVRQLAEGLSIDPSGRAFAEIRGLNKEFASPHKVSAFVANLFEKIFGNLGVPVKRMHVELKRNHAEKNVSAEIRVTRSLNANWIRTECTRFQKAGGPF